VKDSVGLKKFYEAHKEKYMLPGKLVVDRLVPAAPLQMKKVMKDIRKNLKKGNSLEGVIRKYNKGGRETLTLVQDTIILDKKEADEYSSWKKGSVHTVHGEREEIWYVVEKVPARLAPLKDQLGIVTSDYQDYLEKQWIETLKKKYPVVVNREVFNRLKKELEKG
jgi:peptidyl-prolyl cis-trans isomerase SurA